MDDHNMAGSRAVLDFTCIPGLRLGFASTRVLENRQIHRRRE
ncbi:hypothetical protein ebA4157 [Aromatoleum aromaticum EbN1]|uniref:Uncharacterized protein n=1 Tax=Aromatoleum aromaticum (strain DSM 19018 / LMG 30748 / EbN1) TaxID=76114 RepID=Q5P2I6_AROAE|nr:hypothetical protein ebA4157 [Aromatoleum aromaticum EbN1]